MYWEGRGGEGRGRGRGRGGEGERGRGEEEKRAAENADWAILEQLHLATRIFSVSFLRLETHFLPSQSFLRAYLPPPAHCASRGIGFSEHGR